MRNRSLSFVLIFLSFTQGMFAIVAWAEDEQDDSARNSVSVNVAYVLLLANAELHTFTETSSWPPFSILIPVEYRRLLARSLSLGYRLFLYDEPNNYLHATLSSSIDWYPFSAAFHGPFIGPYVSAETINLVGLNLWIGAEIGWDIPLGKALFMNVSLGAGGGDITNSNFDWISIIADSILRMGIFLGYRW